MNLGLLEGGHGLGIESGGVRGSRESGGGVVGEGTHEGPYGGSLGGAGDGDDGRLHRQRLLGQPPLEPFLQLLKLGLKLRYWVLPHH